MPPTSGPSFHPSTIPWKMTSRFVPSLLSPVSRRHLPDCMGSFSRGRRLPLLNSANPRERDPLRGQTTSYGPNDSVSHRDQHPVPNRMVCTLIFLVSMADSHRTLGTQINRTPTSPTSSNLFPTSRRRDLPSAVADYSSAASVESGSSHGGGTSGASHVNRVRCRSSMLSSSSSGSHYRNLRAPPGSTFGYPSTILDANSSPSVDSLPGQTSPEQWDSGLLSNARSSESLGAISTVSGRSGGKSTVRALWGGEVSGRWARRKKRIGHWCSLPVDMVTPTSLRLKPSIHSGLSCRRWKPPLCHLGRAALTSRPRTGFHLFIQVLSIGTGVLSRSCVGMILNSPLATRQPFRPMRSTAITPHIIHIHSPRLWRSTAFIFPSNIPVQRRPFPSTKSTKSRRPTGNVVGVENLAVRSPR
jgi:hypothetical protein